MHDVTILSALVKSVVDAAAAIGLDADALAARAGIDPAALADPDARIPLAQDIRLWELLSEQPVGLALGEKLGVSSVGVIGYAMQHGATVGDALEWQQRYRAVVHPDVIPRVERRDHGAGPRAVFTHVVPPPFARLRQPVDAYAAAIVSTMRGLTGRDDVRAAFVTFPLSRPADPERYEQFFGCPVAWSGTAIEVAFDADLLDLPLPRADARLFGYLARRADELLERLPAQARWTERVREEIGAMLAQGEPRLEALARRMATSERTLHRRLAEEGSSFSMLLDEARRERAQLLLGDRTLSCSEIAFLLGYAEPAVFFRAFKRWTGTSPQAYRNQSRRPAPPVTT
jgi:AraC-like DNA-binding protein